MILGLTSVTLAQTVTSLPAADTDPFVGSWRTNANKSSPKPAKDASYVRTIARDGDELVFSSRIGSRSVGGEVRENHYRIRCDGLPHRVPCGQVSCITSCIYKAENVVEGETESPD